MCIRLTIDKAGRVVIPKRLREELCLESGDALEMNHVGEQITLWPVRGRGPLTKEHGVYDAMPAHCAIKASAELIYTWNARHYGLCGKRWRTFRGNR